jgi:hypothetical protein
MDARANNVSLLTRFLVFVQALDNARRIELAKEAISHWIKGVLLIGRKTLQEIV